MVWPVALTAAWYFKDSAEEIALGAALHSYATGGAVKWAVTHPKLFGQAIGVGYLTGAIAGTAIAGTFFGAQGAKDAMELYGNPKKFWEQGIMSSPANAWKIGKHLLS